MEWDYNCYDSLWEARGESGWTYVISVGASGMFRAVIGDVNEPVFPTLAEAKARCEEREQERQR